MSIHGDSHSCNRSRLSPRPNAAPVYADSDVYRYPIEKVLGRLPGWRKVGSGYMANCPAHHDCTPSLSIRETPDCTVLIYCHAGCETDEILTRLQLSRRELFASGFTLRYGLRRSIQSVSNPVVSMGLTVNPVERFARILENVDSFGYVDLPRWSSLLHLPIASLREFGIRTAGDELLIPEFDANKKPVGVQYRDESGERRCAPGSHRGLSLPATPLQRGCIYVAEGTTDAVALHSVGVPAIGRPAAFPPKQCIDWLIAYLRLHANSVIFVGDNDRANQHGNRVGRDAAIRLATLVREQLEETVSVSWALPPEEFKDVRDQITSGAWNRGLQITEVRS